MKRENGKGCVRKLQGNRKKPWQVILSYGIPRKRVALGTFCNQLDAELFLKDFLRQPLEQQVRPITFASLYTKYYGHQKRFHPKSIRIDDVGYPYCRSLDEKFVSDITVEDLKNVLLQGFRLLDSGEIIQITPSSCEKAKSFLNSIYDYAVQHFYATHFIVFTFVFLQTSTKKRYLMASLF